MLMLIFSSLKAKSAASSPPQEQLQWCKCGQLHLPPQYSIATPSSANEFQSLQVSKVVAQDEGEMPSVRVSIGSGDVFCTKDSSVQDGAYLQLAVHLSNGTGSFSTSTAVTLTCETDVIAVCQSHLSNSLQGGWDTTTVRLLKQDKETGREFAREGVLRFEEELGGGIVSGYLMVDLVRLEEGGGTEKRADNRGFYGDAKIELVSMVLSHSQVTSKHQDHPVILQSIPFDACSCVHNFASSAMPVMISLQRITDHSPSSSCKQLYGAADRQSKHIHAAAGNDIHEVGGTSAKLRSSVMHSALLRGSVIHSPQLKGSVMHSTQQHQISRRAANPPGFRYAASIAENVALDTVVSTVSALKGGSYSIATRNVLFSIDGETGRVRTTGKGGSRGIVVAGDLRGSKEPSS